MVGGYVDGPIGTLSGTRGTREFYSNCTDRMAVP